MSLPASISAIGRPFDASNELLLCGLNLADLTEQKYFAGASCETVPHSLRLPVLAER
jgi:hypothetical protein